MRELPISGTSRRLTFAVSLIVWRSFRLAKVRKRIDLDGVNAGLYGVLDLPDLLCSCR